MIYDFTTSPYTTSYQECMDFLCKANEDFNCILTEAVAELPGQVDVKSARKQAFKAKIKKIIQWFKNLIATIKKKFQQWSSTIYNKVLGDTQFIQKYLPAINQRYKDGELKGYIKEDLSYYTFEKYFGSFGAIAGDFNALANEIVHQRYQDGSASQKRRYSNDEEKQKYYASLRAKVAGSKNGYIYENEEFEKAVKEQLYGRVEKMDAKYWLKYLSAMFYSKNGLKTIKDGTKLLTGEIDRYISNLEQVPDKDLYATEADMITATQNIDAARFMSTICTQALNMALTAFVDGCKLTRKMAFEMMKYKAA